LKNKNINTIFDIGASDGDFSRGIRELFPNAKIYSFEVLCIPYEKLKMNFKDDSLFFAYNIALSNHSGETTFYECESSGSSSLLEMDELHKSSYPCSINNNEIKVECVKLDDFIIEQKIDIKDDILIKIDVQGAEKIVFDGALQIIDRAQIIFSEINFNSMYKENVLFNDLADYLYKKGFKIEGIENVSQSLIDGTYLQVDTYFTKINLKGNTT